MDELFRRLGEAQDAAVLAPRARLVPAARPRRGRRLGFVVGGLAVAGAAALAVIRPPAEVAPRAAAPVATAGTLAAGSSELPLRFADGSIATFRPGSSGRILRQAERGAEVELLSGRVEANIVHARGARWVFRAGPFAVHVTGTRFDVDWAPRARTLAVSLHEGAVTVDGAVLGAGVPLRAGQRLRVALGEGLVRTEDVAPPAAAGAVARSGAPVRALAPVRGRARGGPDDWRALAERGAHAEAWRAATRAGVAELRRTLPPDGLLALADVARYSGAHAEAEAIFRALVSRFPTHRLAGDAVFSLGRLAFEAGDPAMAARWFARYRAAWPDGALGTEALGRLLESTVALGDDAGAASAARGYLERSPEGPYAPLARRISRASRFRDTVGK